MAHTVFQRLGTDLRFQIAFLLVGVAISVAVGLLTGRLAYAALLVNAFNMVVVVARYRQQRSSPDC